MTAAAACTSPAERPKLWMLPMINEDEEPDQTLERKVSFLLPKSPSNPDDFNKTDFSTLLSDKEFMARARGKYP